MIEKAYAKLHGRYYALSGGSTLEALYDLTGSTIEQAFMDNGDEMTKPTYVFNLLKILCQEKCIIGAKLDLEMFPVMRSVVKKRLYA